MAGWNPEESDRVLAQFDAELPAAKGKGADLLFRVSIKLFRQSCIAYRAGAVDLAVLGCRAVIENAGYAVLTHRRTGAGSHTRVPFGAVDRSTLFETREWDKLIRLGDLIRELGRRRTLSKRQVDAAMLIKGHGDGVAHYEATHDRHFFDGIGQAHDGPYFDPPTAADEAEVLTDLRASAEILLQLVRANRRESVESVSMEP